MLYNINAFCPTKCIIIKSPVLNGQYEAQLNTKQPKLLVNNLKNAYNKI